MIKKIGERNFNKELILVIAVFIANLISIYTTQLGYATSSANGNDFIMASIVPWAFAIMLGLVLIYFSFEIIDNGIKIFVVIGYLSVASISIFFNFNGIYTIASKNTNQFEYTEKIVNDFNTLSTSSIFNIEKKIENLNIELSKMKEVADYEGDLINHGKGTKYRKKLGKYRLKLSEYRPKIENFEKSINKINNLKLQVNNIIGSFKGKILENKISAIFSELYGYTKTLNIGNDVNYMKKIEINKYDRGSLEYSLNVLTNTFNGMIEGKPNTADTYRVIYSFIFGVTIDLLMFFVLIFNSFKSVVFQEEREGKEEKKSTNMWGNNK